MGEILGKKIETKCDLHFNWAVVLKNLAYTNIIKQYVIDMADNTFLSVNLGYVYNRFSTWVNWKQCFCTYGVFVPLLTCT